jgi:hypothetical protein
MTRIVRLIGCALICSALVFARVISVHAEEPANRDTA